MILNLGEKRGGICRLDSDFQAFQNMIDDLGFIDTPTKNFIYTWNNRRGGDCQIASKLDHFLLSEELFLSSLETKVSIAPQAGSDHWPIVLTIKISERPKNAPFRFEAFWLSHPDFQNKIKEWWASMPPH